MFELIGNEANIGKLAELLGKSKLEFHCSSCGKSFHVPLTTFDPAEIKSS